RATDPGGVGDDVLEGVADVCRRRARGLPDGDALASWSVLSGVLDAAPHLAVTVLDAVLDRLADDPAARDELLHRSALGQQAVDARRRRDGTSPRA
ncbi:hypothetical protein, partial [Cellulomonas septica]